MGLAAIFWLPTPETKVGRPARDFSGFRKGYLTALERVGTSGPNPIWRCRCDCGNVVDLPSAQLHGATKSCGCRRWEAIAASKTTHGKGRKGSARSRIYRIWASMLTRCNNQNAINYGRYGALGVRVCDEWHKFEPFYAAMGDPPGDEYSLDRIDPEGNYEPGNCRWATRSEQAVNTRRRKQ